MREKYKGLKMIKKESFNKCKELNLKNNILRITKNNIFIY